MSKESDSGTPQRSVEQNPPAASPEDSERSDRSTGPSMTRGERVRAAARTLREPRTASWIAEETEVSVKTAQKYLDQLVEDNVLLRVEQGEQTLYALDQLMASYREVAILQRDHSREELTSALESMRDRITDWKAAYEVEQPGELRASLAVLDDEQEIESRREAANEWEQLETRLPLVQAALREYDLATEREPITA
jgi:predicted DNA-binding transcriptional regulator YafY